MCCKGEGRKEGARGALPPTPVAAALPQLAFSPAATRPRAGRHHHHSSAPPLPPHHHPAPHRVVAAPRTAPVPRCTRREPPRCELVGGGGRLGGRAPRVSHPHPPQARWPRLPAPTHRPPAPSPPSPPCGCAPAPVPPPPTDPPPPPRHPPPPWDRHHPYRRPPPPLRRRRRRCRRFADTAASVSTSPRPAAASPPPSPALPTPAYLPPPRVRASLTTASRWPTASRRPPAGGGDAARSLSPPSRPCHAPGRGRLPLCPSAPPPPPPLFSPPLRRLRVVRHPHRLVSSLALLPGPTRGRGVGGRS